MKVELDQVSQAVEDIQNGQPVVVIDDELRENEADLVFAAQKASPRLIAFMMTWCRGLICVPMTGHILDRLSLPQMVDVNTERHGTAFTVSVDARDGISTGISATDRAKTISILCDPASTPEDLARPGHVFPLRAATGGVLRRPGHTEASVDLARLAGLAPAGVICEILTADGRLMRGSKLQRFSEAHCFHTVKIGALIQYRMATDS
jgi:3,4-dihydroxy 2-butanone 4-phosphate synthase/GTP cyclohydrolase II